MPEYKPVPVSVAQQLSRDHDKDVVVVLTWSREHQRWHATTFGRCQEDKQIAADISDYVMFEVLDQGVITMEEDFRSPERFPVQYLDGRSDW